MADRWRERTCEHPRRSARYALKEVSIAQSNVERRMSWNECDAAVKMVDSSDISQAILIADRGYESYNLLAHCQEKGWKYIIRIKDCTSTGMARKLGLKEYSEYDELNLKITRKNSNYTKDLFKNFLMNIDICHQARDLTIFQKSPSTRIIRYTTNCHLELCR
ncbi:MAG: transposase [Clostridiales bacterium]|nr:transposase [Candidatus Crickella equi]